MNSKKIKVAIGMSGGVDSSVAALLLKQQGYQVIGFFMKLWHDPCGTGENACCDERAQMDARRVAKMLEIPFYVVDVRAPFKKEVTNYFISEYSNLRTPNPCVVCNKKIKFGWLLDFAIKNDCDFLATGHYARIEREVKSQKSKVKSNEPVFHLLKAKDESKDQSYFLSGLDQKQLSKVILALGELTKCEVRKIAEKHNLPVYKKKESQEVCFVEKDYRDFLKGKISAPLSKAGEIVDMQGQILGAHNGLINYTIGQRKGVIQSVQSSVRKPLYVLRLDSDKNRLIVGTDQELYKEEMKIKNLHLIDPDFSNQENLTVKIRSQAFGANCILKNASGSNPVVRFAEPQRAITPGQYAVFYAGDEVMGNGQIVE